ncbi:histone-lysine n-methyltransferase h3 lysine-9 specific suvh5 [Phtheirospermum japonicum]|uniref:Histone-lysine n-methyltransferase h3 lysine-9 specific suvh5 n=1 Tax=Phtheirospermum japonicum TaxID=374723 RepID=A0A830CPZ1_9LAMI|nr:histone-lysine n-methyltransferase h3 lysine-9 specific suvh5 [Phtheirospermum japonicum]
MPSKRLFENGPSFNSRRPLNFKHRRLDAVRSFPANCGLAAHSDPIRATPIACVNSLSSNNININPSSEKYALAIPAVPLRSVPALDLKRDTENPIPSVVDGKRTDRDNENTVCEPDESWEHDLEKIAAVIADAKSYLNGFDQLTPVEREEKSEVCVISREEWSKSARKCDGGAKKVKSDGQSEVCERTETKCGEENRERNFMDLDECESLSKTCDSNNEPNLINLGIVKHEEPRGVMVTEALKLFDEYYEEIVKGERKSAYPHLEAVERLKGEGKYIFPDKPFGHIPGVEIGDEFRFRSQLALVGIHRQLIAGIDHVSLGGKKYATSVVESGRYENTSKTVDVLIYSGQGGNLKIVDNIADQKLEKGNLALVNSMEMGYPVRVTYKRTNYKRGVVYVYDGLYTVKNLWQERDQSGKLVFKFELHRMPGQPRSCPFPKPDPKPEKVETGTEVCVVDDISLGREKIPVRAMNGVDDDRPPEFTYVTSTIYPSWYKPVNPVGCDCVNGCSDSRQCPCVVKNGGEIPYNEKGLIIKVKKGEVHECGLLCKCPPTCMNRVGQHGPRYRLEIFKTEKRGWGVRSRDHIPSGGLICEYLGEFLREKEADLRIGGDEYLFDIFRSRGGRAEGFSIDGAIYGNVGRFINHSCSPNLYAQKIMYDHGDERMPHIIFFATKEIPPLTEIFYDYNYKLGSVCDANGNVKIKACHCGSRKCSKRMY